ncbi:MAG: UDP-glucose 4-epimerase GalE, partial [Stackebrandtia sp.]
MSWLVTGGAGYIGSHVVRRLRQAGVSTVVFDDLSAGNARRVPSDVPLCEGRLTDRSALTAAMSEHGVTGVVNLAARKSAPESVSQPLWYYRDNVGGLITLLDAMRECGVTRLVQSSSAAVYGGAPGPTHTEETPTAPLSPYAESKLIGEHILRDVAAVDDLSYLALRYFNPVGAEAAELAEGKGENVIAILFRAVDAGKTFGVTGDDFDTRDGSGLRDYIHISDLASAHAEAVRHLETNQAAEVVNVGTGRGYTVFELLETVRTVTGLPVPHEVV